jgi:hypothetical protein
VDGASISKNEKLKIALPEKNGGAFDVEKQEGVLFSRQRPNTSITPIWEYFTRLSATTCGDNTPSKSTPERATWKHTEWSAQERPKR